MYEPHFNDISDANEDNESVNEIILEDETTTTITSQNNSRPTIHWGPVVDGDLNGKEQINTDAQHFDALFARSNASPLPPSSHPRCYSSCSPATAPSLLAADTPSHPCARSQPLLSSSPSLKQRQSYDITSNTNHRQSISSSPPKIQQTNPPSAQAKRKNFSLTHTAQTFLQASNSQNELPEPLARSCSYKRPQSMKKYRQKKEKEKEKEQQQQQQDFPVRKYSTAAISQNNYIPHTVTSDSSRKSITAVTARIPTTDFMTAEESQDQWPTQHAQRSERIGKINVFFFLCNQLLLESTRTKKVRKHYVKIIVI